VVLTPSSGRSGVPVALMAADTPPPKTPRVHLDLYARDRAHQEWEVERLVALGAARVDWDLYPADPGFVVLADPAGNLFCVIDTAHG
jgi:glyoxalase superfamily protein